MSFMSKVVTTKQSWLEIDGTHGTTFVPFDVLSESESKLAMDEDDTDAQDDLQEHFGDYYEGKIYSVSVTEGYGARLSAAGYMDCTDWAVFDTEAEASAYLEETYGDDEDSEDSE